MQVAYFRMPVAAHSAFSHSARPVAPYNDLLTNPHDGLLMAPHSGFSDMPISGARQLPAQKGAIHLYRQGQPYRPKKTNKQRIAICLLPRIAPFSHSAGPVASHSGLLTNPHGGLLMAPHGGTSMGRVSPIDQKTNKQRIAICLLPRIAPFFA